jgi:hypothetical protein
VSDRFTKDKLTWLDQVVRDHRVSDLGFRVGYVLASHVNRKSLEAWPTHETLTNALAVSRSSVIRAIAELERTGHLAVKRAHGRHLVNVYRWILKRGNDDEPQFEFGEESEATENVSGVTPFRTQENVSAVTPLDGGKRVSPDTSVEHEKVSNLNRKGVKSDQKRCQPCYTEHFEEHSEEHLQGHNGQKRGGRRRKARAAIPANLEITEKQLADAAAEGWNSQKARAQFPRFCDHTRADGRLLADVDAAWRNWVRKGVEFDARDRQRNSGRPTGLQSGFEGVSEWLHEGGEEQ